MNEASIQIYTLNSLYQTINLGHELFYVGINDHIPEKVKNFCSSHESQKNAGCSYLSIGTDIALQY